MYTLGIYNQSNKQLLVFNTSQRNPTADNNQVLQFLFSKVLAAADTYKLESMLACFKIYVLCHEPPVGS